MCLHKTDGKAANLFSLSTMVDYIDCWAIWRARWWPETSASTNRLNKPMRVQCRLRGEQAAVTGRWSRGVCVLVAAIRHRQNRTTKINLSVSSHSTVSSGKSVLYPGEQQTDRERETWWALLIIPCRFHFLFFVCFGNLLRWLAYFHHPVLPLFFFKYPPTTLDHAVMPNGFKDVPQMKGKTK